MTRRIHFFPFADPDSVLFCGDFSDGDGWTRRPDDVTCQECGRRLMTGRPKDVVPEATDQPR